MMRLFLFMLSECGFDHVSDGFNTGNAFLTAVCDKGESRPLVPSASSSISCETCRTMQVEQSKRKLINFHILKMA